MTIRTLALASAATSIQDHRLALGAFMGPGSTVLERRGGIYYYPGAADLVSASALQANVTPFVAVVDGTSNSLQGQVVVVADANETLTFAAGEAAVARTDRVVLQVRDNTFDASGSTDARVVIVKGNTSTGAATAVPASSLLLWEVVVPIGASSITFSSARTDRRQWIATPMRIPVNSSTERDALPAIPGLEVTRLDTGDIQQYWSSAWRTLLPVAAPTSQVSFVRKTSDTARSNAASQTADPHLTLAVAANSTYLFDGFLIYSGPTAADFAFGFTLPSGATSQFAAHTLADTAGATYGDIDMRVYAPPSVFFMGAAASNAASMPRGIIRTGGTAGNVTLIWSQVIGNASATTLYADSYIRLEKVA
ncbi:hypothetical protein SAMN05216275_14174 [Streptosporangium canum]|uniref:Uncharacterized protein n=1 Tax=Streptosporangium canum TaxID=324952 RepID=A0A1I4DIR4_9ACTN|nr:hypothetical protein [Streptosporangium canum]SFK92779.1 hypothetical protein SAMN05216275_14174 [Streptosporangium canum]